MNEEILEEETTPKLLDLNGLEQYNEHIQGQIGNLWENVNSISDNMQNRMQYDEMPEAGEDLEYRIIQYTGDTDNTYTKGYFYKCVGDYTQSEPTFSWEQIDVQPAGGGSSGIPYYTWGTNATGGTYSNPLNIATANAGIYMSYNGIQGTLYYTNPGDQSSSSVIIQPEFIIYKKYSDCENNEIFMKMDSAYQGDTMIFKKDTTKTSGITMESTNYPVYASTKSYISAKWYFNSNLPESNKTPTSNNQLTPKSYVDSAISTAIGTALTQSY